MRAIRQPAGRMLILPGVLFLTTCHPAPDSPSQVAGSEDVATGAGVSSARASQAVIIPAGTEIEVRLIDPIGSAQSQSGGNFLAALEQPIVVDDWVAIPRGTSVTGKVVDVKLADRLKARSEVTVTLTGFELGRGSCPIQTLSYRYLSPPREGDDITGRAAVRDARTRAPSGKNKRTSIAAAPAYTVGKGDIILLPSETPLRFVLRQAVTINKAG